MKNIWISRRSWTKGLAATLVAGRGGASMREAAALKNDAIEFSIVLADGRVVSRVFRNRLADEAIDLPSEDFAFEFQGGETILASALRARLLRSTRDRIDVEHSGAGVTIQVSYGLDAGKSYLRKQLRIRRENSAGRLMRANLENWKGVRRPWDSMHADYMRCGSHPIFCDTLWAGVEFVVAFNDYGEDGFRLGSRPGGIEVGEEWVPMHPTITGVSEPGAVRAAFLAYLDDIRVAPPRLAAVYNSWWTLPKVVLQEENLALIRTLKAKLFDPHGVFFDIITTDMGWSDPHSVWQIDRATLPHGFDDIRPIVESAGGKLGLWMSPSEYYPPVCDYEWMKQHGYCALMRGPNGKEKLSAVSLADPKYRNATKAQLGKLIRENNLGHVKYDGFVARENVAHDGLLPGDDSIEPLARYSLELLEASKQANPHLVTEPTYMNSLVNYISPWILQHSDSVWGNAGGDLPLGIAPAPDYRESHTNAREWYIFSSLNEFWLPQNAVHYFDIVQCDAAEGFANHAAMAFGRGRFFVSTYINPKFMTDGDWSVYAGMLRWARANQDVLRNTIALPSRVELGEPYAYAHWLGERGILAVRNPSNETREYMLDLGRSGAPRGLADAVCYAQYPYRKGIGQGLDSKSVLPLRLAPWELLFLEIVPQGALREPVALGARWFRENGQMAVVPERGAGGVEILLPDGSRRTVPVASRPGAQPRGEILSQSQRLNLESKPEPSIEFEFVCDASIPEDAAGGKLLLLIQYPGSHHYPSACTGALGGQRLALEERVSTGHIGARLVREQWKGIQPYECEWSWWIGELPPGTSRVKLQGTAASEKARFGLWLWAEDQLGGKQTGVPIPCTEPDMPQYNAGIGRQGICLRPPQNGTFPG